MHRGATAFGEDAGPKDRDYSSGLLSPLNTSSLFPTDSFEEDLLFGEVSTFKLTSLDDAGVLGKDDINTGPRSGELWPEAAFSAAKVPSDHWGIEDQDDFFNHLSGSGSETKREDSDRDTKKSRRAGKDSTAGRREKKHRSDGKKASSRTASQFQRRVRVGNWISQNRLGVGHKTSAFKSPQSVGVDCPAGPEFDETKMEQYTYSGLSYVGPTLVRRPKYKSKQNWEWYIYPHGVSRMNGKIRIQIKQRGSNPFYPYFPNTLEGVLEAAFVRDLEILRLWNEGTLVRTPKLNFVHAHTIDKRSSLAAEHTTPRTTPSSHGNREHRPVKLRRRTNRLQLVQCPRERLLRSQLDKSKKYRSRYGRRRHLPVNLKKYTDRGSLKCPRESRIRSQLARNFALRLPRSKLKQGFRPPQCGLAVGR